MAQGLAHAGVSQFLANGDRPGERALDRVYETFAKSDPFQPVTGFVDHATMGAEALVALGLGEQVKGWIARQRPRSYDAPTAGIAIAADWKAALGRRDCHGDWIAYFDDALDRRPFADVLATWLPRFAHEPGALLFHGLIRTGHATRALDHDDTPARRAELARGLALWAIGIRGAPPDTADGAADAETMLDYARSGAAAFLRNPSIVVLHYVTGPMGYMLLGDHGGARAHRFAAEGFARTHGKLAAAGQTPAESVPTFDRTRIEGLARQSNVHAIKLTEAAFRAYEVTGDALFLHAAARMH
ncbi:MAG: hypothetical protein ACREFD_05875 [Stellaceae bacterium]